MVTTSIRALLLLRAKKIKNAVNKMTYLLVDGKVTAENKLFRHDHGQLPHIADVETEAQHTLVS